MQHKPIALIQIIGSEIIPNIYDVFLLKPEKIISWKTQKNSSADKLSRIFALMAAQAEHQIIEDHSLLFQQASNLKQQGYEVIFNITGGKKHAALLLFEFIQNKYPAFYLDQTGNKFVDVGSTRDNPLFEKYLQRPLPLLEEIVDVQQLLCLYFEKSCGEDEALLQKYRQLYQILTSENLCGKLNNIILSDTAGDKQIQELFELFSQKYPHIARNKTLLLKDLHFAVALNEQMQGYDNSQAKVYFNVPQIDALVYINGTFYCMACTLLGKNQRLIPNFIKYIGAAAKLDSFSTHKFYYCTSKHAMDDLTPFVNGCDITLAQICTNSRNILVQFVGTVENHHNALDALRLKPEIIVQFHSKESARMQKNLQKALQKAKCKSQIIACKIASTTDMQAFAKQIKSTLDKYTYPRYNLHFNLSGGTKLLTREMHKYALTKRAGIYLMGDDGAYIAMHACGNSSPQNYQKQLNKALDNYDNSQILGCLVATHGYQIHLENKDNWCHMALNDVCYTEIRSEIQNSLHKINPDQRELNEHNIIKFHKYFTLLDNLRKQNVLKTVENNGVNVYTVNKLNLNRFNTIFLGGIAWEKDVHAALTRSKQIGRYKLQNDSFLNNIEWNNEEMFGKRIEEDLIGFDENYRIIMISCKINFEDRNTLIQNIIEHAARCRTIGGNHAIPMFACKNILEMPQNDLQEVLDIAEFYKTTLLLLDGQPVRVHALSKDSCLAQNLESAVPV